MFIYSPFNADPCQMAHVTTACHKILNKYDSCIIQVSMYALIIHHLIKHVLLIFQSNSTDPSTFSLTIYFKDIETSFTHFWCVQ